MKKNSALTLIELLITITILGILITFSYPQYQHYLTRTYRIRAAQNLLILSKNLQYYHIQQQSYLDATITEIAPLSVTNDKHYQYRINKLMANSYQLVAIPQGIQAKRDYACGSLMINQLIEKSISGTAPLDHCWQ